MPSRSVAAPCPSAASSPTRAFAALPARGLRREMRGLSSGPTFGILGGAIYLWINRATEDTKRRAGRKSPHFPAEALRRQRRERTRRRGGRRRTGGGHRPRRHRPLPLCPTRGRIGSVSSRRIRPTAPSL